MNTLFITQLKAIANESRIKIIGVLMDNQEHSVAQINAEVLLSQSALSQHLAVLRKAQIVKTRRASQTIYYSLGNANLAKTIGALYEDQQVQGVAQ